MSILNKLAIGSLAALALFSTKRKGAATVTRATRDAEPAKQARHKPAKRRAPVRRVKSA
jgi:hypothetical protein